MESYLLRPLQRSGLAGPFAARLSSLSKSSRLGTGISMGLPFLGLVFCVRFASSVAMLTPAYLDAFPTDHPLWPIRAKIARVDAHLEVLANEIAPFLKGRPYTVVRERDDQAGQYVWRAQIHKSPDPKWGLLVSEIVHHLYSALDHIAWLVACRSSGTPPKGTGFPIYPSVETYRNKWSRDSGYFQTRGMPIHAEAIIEDEQPYHRGQHHEGHLLSILRRLANADKHQALMPLGSAVGKGSVNVTQEGGTVPVKPVKFIDGPFEHGAIVARWPLPAPGPKGMKLQMDVHFAFHIALGHPTAIKGREIIGLLVDMRNAVSGIVDRLAPFV
jgi:hypothetical protein